MKSMERRSETRNMCADMVEVRWKTGSGRDRSATALLEDISASGACLQLETALAPGTAITWEFPNRSFAGRVRYCEYREIGYFVGVEFAQGSKWSKRAYRPQHMLDLKKLIK
jgi:hypothetical protein